VPHSERSVSLQPVNGPGHQAVRVDGRSTGSASRRCGRRAAIDPTCGWQPPVKRGDGELTSHHGRLFRIPPAGESVLYHRFWLNDTPPGTASGHRLSRRW